MSAFSSVGDRVPDHVGGQRDRKSVSRIDGDISGDRGLRIKIVVLQRIMLTRRVTHRYGSCGPRPRDVCAKQQGRERQIALYRGLFPGLTPLPMAQVARPGGCGHEPHQHVIYWLLHRVLWLRDRRRSFYDYADHHVSSHELAHGGQGDRPNGSQACRSPLARRIVSGSSGHSTQRLWRLDTPLSAPLHRWKPADRA
jgi:hypothetical protein